MSSADPSLRKRQSNTSSKKMTPPSSSESDSESESLTRTKTKTPAKLAKEEDNRITLLDALRGVVLVVLVSSALSYFVTRDSFLWNIQRPRWTRTDVVKGWFTPPKEYTDASLRLYTGTNPALPLLLAINGTIYDVTAGARHYGPGGSYHAFVGADASRAFVTSCFKEDRKPDMRGVEEMFIPLDDPEVDSLFTAAEFEEVKRKERADAERQVFKALKHWVDFFANNPKYPKVGVVKREVGWETKGKAPPLCREAREGRPKRRQPPPGKTVRSKATDAP